MSLTQRMHFLRDVSQMVAIAIGSVINLYQIKSILKQPVVCN